MYSCFLTTMSDSQFSSNVFVRKSFCGECSNLNPVCIRSDHLSSYTYVLRFCKCYGEHKEYTALIIGTSKFCCSFPFPF